MKNDLYQQFVINYQKDLLVIAGPGSGKTTTIIAKVNKILENCKENDILLISFTNKSVDDIKRKLKNNVKVMTFHKLAIDILKYNHIAYQICNENLLSYIIDEYYYFLNKKEQKKLLRYLKINTLDVKSYEYQSFKKLIITFIKLFKTNNNDFKKLQQLVFKYPNKFILKIILDIFLKYEQEKKSQNLLDFDDLIILATKVLKEKYNYFKYKYIIIDEFQDTSVIRLNLIKTIYKNSLSIITAVGDDCQSIYHFSGCDLNLILNFQKYFPNSITYYLKNTYRYSQNVINISENFIEKNPFQLHHQMQSASVNKTDIKIITYFNEKKILEKTLNKINEDDILILYRNKKDLTKYLNSKFMFDKDFIYYNDKKIRHLTIHSAKGLESNFVIVLGLENNILGFPNKLEDHPIIDYIKNPLDNFPYCEERRIFFVAITRSKKQTYLLVPFYNPSIFIKEIKQKLQKN